MINVAATITTIIEEDDHVLQDLRAGILNLSSYARIIQPEVEKRTLKEVKLKSIVVALSRMAKTSQQNTDQFNLRLQNLSVHSHLIDIAFEKTKENLKRISELINSYPTNGDAFLAITQGLTEITIIAENSFIDSAKNVFDGVQPVSELTELAGITVKLDISYLNVPRVFYELTYSLQTKKISIVEIVSTATEITFIINKADVQIAIPQLSKFLH